MASSNKLKLRKRRKFRIRKKVRGTSDCPRLTVYRSLRYVYAQLIDDDSGAGLQVVVEDIDGDGNLDILNANKKGIILFLQNGE